MRQSSTSRERQRATPWMWVASMVCALLLLIAGTVQACHVHDAQTIGKPRQAMLLAPAEDCPWCAAAQVAMPATEQATVALLPRVECATVRPIERASVVVWSATMFSRPPPVAADLAS